MTNLVHSMLRSAGTYIGRGIYHQIGADPTKLLRNGGMEFEWLGKRMFLKPGDIAPQMLGAGGPPSLGGMGWGALAIGSGIFSVASGYASGGVAGAGQAFMRDLAVDAALVKYGYSGAMDKAGVTRLTAGRVPPGRALPRLGKFNNYDTNQSLFGKIVGKAAGAARAGDFFARMGAGSIMAGAASNMVGGGVLGVGAGFLGGALGVKHAWKLAGLGATYYMGKTVAKGAYSVVKAGYTHQQYRKQIQTDGDMSAFMTMGAHTMRERAVQAIQRSHMNARSALGSEASYMSNPSRSYFSAYRQF